MPTRREEQDFATVLNALSRRVKILEETCASRVLPPGFQFGTDGSNLTITRLSDGATTVITIP